MELVWQSGCVQETDIHLYIIQVGSSLLNHLHNSWCAELLVSLAWTQLLVQEMTIIGRLFTVMECKCSMP
jgi:hypothetical protein